MAKEKNNWQDYQAHRAITVALTNPT